MRPVAIAQNLLRYPLNELLGTEAHVRILRTLAGTDAALSVRELSERAGITPAGTHRALQRLRKTGFVVVDGGARGQRHALRRTDPLLRSLIELFETEERRYEELIEAIRERFYRTSPPPISAWVSQLPRESGDPLEIALLGDTGSLSETVRNLRSELTDVEQRFDVTVELHGYTRADLPAIDPLAHIYLAGAPVGVKPSRAGGLHRDRELEASRMSSVVAELIQRDQLLVGRARQHVERALARARGPARRDLEEWHEILNTYSLNRLRSFLGSRSERAVRLRQSSPFWAVLSEEQKSRIRKQTEPHDP